jgi:uncharacterized ubiquitin-like protein YukD
MADIKVQIVLPTGGTSEVELPDDAPMRDLLPELVTALSLPTTATDGRPMSYRIDSKELGRQLQDDETLAAAGVKDGGNLILSPSVTAGGGELHPMKLGGEFSWQSK